MIPAARLLAIFLLGTFPSISQAEISLSDSWVVDGFGTLGVTHSNEDQADYVSNRLAPDGAGHTDTWSAKIDSRLGLQLSGDFTSRISGVLQIISEQRHDGTFQPMVEWANVSVELTPEWGVRVGRLVLPAFMSSEYRKVGYAIPSARPAPEVYYQVPITNLDGIDISYRRRLHGATNTLHLLYGQKDSRIADGYEVKPDNVIVVSNTLEWGAATVFLSYSETDITFPATSPIFDGFRQFGPAGEAIASQFDIDNAGFSLFSLGGRYDPGQWFVLGEWAVSRSDSVIGDHRGWYVTGGYRHGTFTPYVTLADISATSPTSNPGLPFPQAQPLNAALNELLFYNSYDQSRAAAGVRWDFATGKALKFQYDYIDLGAGSRGILSNHQPGFTPGGDLSLISVNLDFVF